MKRVKFLLTIIIIMIVLVPSSTIASAKSVQAEIPSFPVTLNELNFSENEYAQYPLLVYGGITYLPMTWYLSRMLNLITTWNAEDGLIITKGNSEEPKEFQYETPATKRNNRTCFVTIVDTKVTVNEKVIDNRNEPYPLLLFRGMTYFPLTWRFAVDEFGWSYTFDQVSGLCIKADNFFYVSSDYGSGHIDEYGSSVSPTETHYIKGDLRILLKTEASFAWAGAVGSNLSIMRNGFEIRPDGWFGYYQNHKGPFFTVEDNTINTTYHDGPPGARNVRPIKVSIETGQIIFE